MLFNHKYGRLVVQKWCIGVLLVTACGCVSSLPVGTKNGKVASRYAGNGLFVSSQPGTAELVAQKTHVVSKGETLWRIAQKYKTSVAELKKFNNISDASALSIGADLGCILRVCATLPGE